MSKKVSSIQKKEIIYSFINGTTLAELSEKYNYSKITITRYLKDGISKEKYKDLLAKNKKIKPSSVKDNADNLAKNTYSNLDKFDNKTEENDVCKDSPFIEISPVDYNIDNFEQKELSSVPLSEINFPNHVYLIVNNKIELETKLLKDYPNWQFLSPEELNRKTIQIHYDLKIAKRFCNKEQKVIKVPNTDVFRIVAPILKSRGISRIVSDEDLIVL